MNQTIIVSVVALAVGSVAGFFVGQSNTEDPRKNSELVKKQINTAKRSNFASGISAQRRESARGKKVFRSSAEVFRQGTQVSRLEDLIGFYSQLDAYELEAEVDNLASIGMPDRMLASYLLFAQWAELDPVGAMAKTDSLGRMGVFSKSTVLKSWASTDPEAAASFYASNKKDFAMLSMMGGDRRGGGMSPTGSIAGEWAKESPDDALAWALSQEGNEGRQAVGSIFTELARTDPDKAARMAVGLDAESQEAAYRSIARTLGANDYEAAEAWIGSLPTDSQSEVKLTALESLAGRDPDKAASLLGEISDQDDQLELIDEIASGYARSDGAAGVEFLIENGDLAALSNSINDPMRLWVASDADNARNYALAMEEGQVRDTTMKSYIIADRGNDDFSGQLDLASSIQNETERGDAYSVVMNRFVRSDEDAARAYLEQDPNISPEQQQEIIDGAKRGGRRGGFGRR